MLKGYKLVSIYNRTGEKLKISYNLHKTDPECVIYKENEIAKRNPKFGALCLFGTLKDALNYIDSLNIELDGLELWECEYELSDDTEIWGEDGRMYFNAIPSSTVYADSITLLSNIKIS